MTKSTICSNFLVIILLPATFAQLDSYIKGFGSGKCITVHGNSNDNGAGIEIYDCIVGATNQFWSSQDAGQGRFHPTLTNGIIFKVKNSGKCLDVQDQRTDNLAPIIQWDCIHGGQNNQLWEVIRSNQAGYHQIRNPVSNKCVSVMNGVTTNLAGLVLWNCDNGQNVKWSQMRT